MATGWASGTATTALGTLTSGGTWIQLHTATPGAAGTTAVANSGTRQQVTWGTASAGAIASASTLTWTSVTDTVTYAFFSAWSASTSGTFAFSGSVTANGVTAGDSFSIPTGSLTASITIAS